MSAVTGKELYEHLEVLHQAVSGTLAEASLDYVVDQLLRMSSAGCSVRADMLREDIVKSVAKYQNVYVPIPDPESGK